MAIDFDRVRKRRQEMKSNDGDLNFMKTKEIPMDGYVEVRIMPPLDNQKGLPYVAQVGFWINNKFYASMESVWEDCLASEIMLKAQGMNSELRDLLKAKAFRKTTSFLIPVVEVDTEGYPMGTEPRILQAPKTIAEAISDWVCDPDYADIDSENGICDLEVGVNLRIYKSEGNNNFTQYDVKPRRKATDLEIEWETPDIMSFVQHRVKADEDPLIDAILEYLDLDLDDLGLEMPDREELDEKEEEKPKAKRASRKSSTTPKKRATKAKAKESEDDAGEEEEEEEEEEEPKRKSRRGRPKKEVAPDKDAGEEEEEEEEPKPKRRRGRPKNTDDEVKPKRRRGRPKKEESEEEEGEEEAPRRRRRRGRSNIGDEI